VNIGSRIKKRRTQLKMSADELARKISKDRSTIYRYENGGIDKVAIDMLEPLASALETTPTYLIGMDQSDRYASTHVVKDGFAATYISTNTAQVKNMERWAQEVGHVEFTEEENEEFIRFAKYLLFRRTLKEE
jgi:transcriptional regulator with XRE-family HTH domain